MNFTLWIPPITSSPNDEHRFSNLLFMNISSDACESGMRTLHLLSCSKVASCQASPLLNSFLGLLKGFYSKCLLLAIHFQQVHLLAICSGFRTSESSARRGEIHLKIASSYLQVSLSLSSFRRNFAWSNLKIQNVRIKLDTGRQPTARPT